MRLRAHAVLAYRVVAVIYGSCVRPLVWTNRRAAASAACVGAWLVSVELGTSRSASREAAPSDDACERVVDTSTSRLFDAAAATALVGGLAASLSLTKPTIRMRTGSYVAGLSLLGGAGALSVAARRHLGRFHRDSLTVHSDHELVDTGPYQRIRHPLYTATIGVFVGFGAVLGNWVSLALAALPTAALVHRIAVEERMLVETFGDEYVRYCARTHRLLPRIW
jgi:protein-S-isoprenylcysteine O-methyltransferase Ste14